MGSLKTLAASMRRRAEKLPTLAHEVSKAGCRAVIREWVDIMPVDTSEALSNTRVGIGSRPEGPLPAFFVGRRGSTRGASAGKVLDDALAELKTKQPGQQVWLSNTAPHIGDLDRGTSTQFAGGFIPAALIVFRLAARQEAAKLLK